MEAFPPGLGGGDDRDRPCYFRENEDVKQHHANVPPPGITTNPLIPEFFYRVASRLIVGRNSALLQQRL